MWTLVEDLAVSSLNVGLDGVQATEHHLTAGAPTETETNPLSDCIF